MIREPTTFAGIDFHFFGDFSVIKASKLRQTTRCKTCLFDVLANGGLTTNHGDSKPTETFQYTHFNSCHPPSIKNGFIKGEAMRLLRTNSSKTTFEESLMKFKQRLRTRGYPKTIIEKSLSGVNFATRPSALTQKKIANERILPFVNTYHPAVSNLKQTLMEQWNLIQNQPLLKTIYLKPLIISYKRGKSLKDTLVRSKI